MRIVIVKTSSLGDVVHMLPALSDAARCRQELGVDWVVEEGFSAIPRWHPQVDRVIPVAFRRWRKAWRCRQTWQEIHAFRTQLRQRSYAAIIDSQGLYKSALLASWTQGPRWGYDWQSAREPLAAWVYHHTVRVPWDLHAIERNRRLLAAALDYRHEALPLDYGVMPMRAQLPRQGDRPHPSYVVGLHGTSRVEKEWPEPHWRWLGRWLSAHGLGLVLPWDNTAERERAERITRAVPSGYVLPKLDLDALAAVLIRAVAVVGVDTGLMHVAAAWGCPGLALYSATDPARTGIIGALPAAPIYMLAGAEALSTEAVGRRLQQLFEKVRVRGNLNIQAKIGLF